MKNNKVVLAFSGGLDTSYCVKYLQNERGLEVYTALVNTGGFSEKELKKLEEKAISLGSKKHVTLEQTQAFYDQAVRYLVYGNVLRNGNYPLSVSAERMFQAMAIAEYAKEVGAGYVAHGSTGAGNDQVRFDLAFQLLAPGVEVITPIREQQLSRQQEIEYLQANGVDWDWRKGKYSINQGLWGTSVGGAETLTSNQPLPEEAWPVQVTATGVSQITLHFEGGQLTGLNGEMMDSVKAIRTLERIAAPYGVGRDIHVGDTIIGLKGRVGFAAAAPV
ncbi:MAG: argininosuccinate synthase domain-containing protein, partial [Bacteroidota bacterium]